MLLTTGNRHNIVQCSYAGGSNFWPRSSSRRPANLVTENPGLKYTKEIKTHGVHKTFSLTAANDIVREKG